MQTGVQVAVKVLRSGMQVEAIELVDGQTMHTVNRSGLSSQKWPEVSTLFMKFAGPEQTVKDQIEFVSQICTEYGAVSSQFSDQKERIDIIWGARKCMGMAILSMKKDPSDLFLHTDAAIPISKMAELVERSNKIVEESEGGWFSCNVGHVGDGECSISPPPSALSF